MSLDAAEIAALVEELRPLVGARVDAARVHAERTITLEVFSRSDSATLLLSAEADLTRLHAVARRPPAPASPFGFQAVLRRELEGAQLAAIEAAAGERVVTLRFLRAAGPLSLVAELTGRNGNLFLVREDGTILASAGRNLSQRRELVAGRPYVPPAPRDVRGLPSPALPSAGGEGVVGSAEPPPLSRAAGEGQGGGAAPRFAPVPGARFPLSAAVEAAYAEKERERLLADARRRLREPLRGALARSRRALDKLAEEAARVPAAEVDRRAADLIKQNFQALRRGAREARVTEYTADGPRQVTIALDAALGPRENMERYYRRYRRIVESAARVAARAAEVRDRVAALAALLAEVDGAGEGELARLEREARKLSAGPKPPQAPRRRKEEEPAPPHRLFRSLSGAEILVGRGAADNDRLTLRIARGNDLWLHARGQKGAHVVVRLPGKGAGPDQETLLDAAHLAAHFSDARGEPLVEVTYTRAKYVRKAKGSPPGAVTYSQDRTLNLRIEPARTARLLAEEHPA
ncbi:MAG TPA: NFACT RNA binding domain-containing protein [Anaeromyxobacteraceae bacterium]|jgi:predicted ribosome quality control (RQC) complex YloA/Tae2 family protein|nr:NFACT RNA binding domain-containing protein [Anaeromyxobacteraceae bacterium]